MTVEFENDGQGVWWHWCEDHSYYTIVRVSKNSWSVCYHRDAHDLGTTTGHSSLDDAKKYVEERIS
jgi:hypothetical protein